MTLVTEIKTSKTIRLRDLEEYVGTYMGYDEDLLELRICFDSCQIVFFIDELEDLDSLRESLESLPFGSRIGILAMSKESEKTVLLRLIDTPQVSDC